MTKTLQLTSFFSTLFLALPAFAQVTSGATEVTTEELQHATEQAADVKDTTELDLQGGALVAGGNSQSTALTGSTRFMLRRNVHETSFVAAVNYARARNDTTESMETTIENYQGRLRYDYFFTKNLSAFMAIQARRDRFQGLNVRLGFDPGVAYSFIRNDATRLWGEAGYDLQYDVLTQETLDVAAADGAPRDGTAVDHNLRLFLGFDQKLDDRLALRTGAEMYKSFINNGVRFNFDAELRMQLVNALSLAVGTKTQYNSLPLPGVEKLDVTTSASFVYTFL